MVIVLILHMHALFFCVLKNHSGIILTEWERRSNAEFQHFSLLSTCKDLKGRQKAQSGGFLKLFPSPFPLRKVKGKRNVEHLLKVKTEFLDLFSSFFSCFLGKRGEREIKILKLTSN